MTPQVFDEQGNAIKLGARLGGGGEGDVFEVAGTPGQCAKILHSTRRTQAKFDKVKAMVARPPAGAYDAIEGVPVLTWPRALIYASQRTGPRTFIGYIMTRVTPRDFVPFFQLTTTHRRQGFGGSAITWDRLVLLGMRLCHVIRTLHKFGYAVGDMNDRNVLVSRRLTPLVMDTDSFQVPRLRWGHFPSIMGDQMYWPPELLDVDFATHKASRVVGDRYALGVLLFQLFMNGLRPYQSRGSAVNHLESLADKTRAGAYPWRKPRPGRLEPPAGAPDYQALPAPIRAAFERCFVAGHRSPNARPSADDWYQALAQVRDVGFQTCTVNARHAYGADLQACPWCEDANDPFEPTRAATPKSRRRVPLPARAAGRSVAKISRRPVATAAPSPRRRGKPPQMTVRGQPPAPPQRPEKARPPARAAQRTATPFRRLATNRRFLQVLWLTFFGLACATPALVLRAMPFGIEAKVTATVVTILLVFMAGAAASWPSVGNRRGRLTRMQVMVLGSWLLLATTIAVATAAAERWHWLVGATAAAAWAAGIVAFAALERGRPGAFRPRPRGFVNSAVGVACAYLPVLVVLVWTRL